MLDGDLKALAASGEKGLVEIIAVTHAGMTTAEFEKIVTDWLATARDQRFKRPYTELVYQPMLELLAYLRANGYKAFIVSGGGVEFMRPWTQRVHGRMKSTPPPETMNVLKPFLRGCVEQFQHRLIDAAPCTASSKRGCFAEANHFVATSVNSSVVMPAWVAARIGRKSFFAASPSPGLSSSRNGLERQLSPAAGVLRCQLL